MQKNHIDRQTVKKICSNDSDTLNRRFNNIQTGVYEAALYKKKKPKFWAFAAAS